MNQKDISSLFWIAFWSALALMLMLGCTTEKKVIRYVEKNPDVLLNWATVDSFFTVQIDTLFRTDSFWTQLPPERIIDSFFIESPCPDLNFGPRIVETTFARATVEIVDGILIMDLENKTDPWKVPYDSAIAEIHRLEKEIIENITQLPAEKKRPWWALPAGIIAIFATALLVLTLLFRK